MQMLIERVRIFTCMYVWSVECRVRTWSVRADERSGVQLCARRVSSSCVLDAAVFSQQSSSSRLLQLRSLPAEADTHRVDSECANERHTGSHSHLSPRSPALYDFIIHTTFSLISIIALDEGIELKLQVKYQGNSGLRGE